MSSIRKQSFLQLLGHPKLRLGVAKLLRAAEAQLLFSSRILCERVNGHLGSDNELKGLGAAISVGITIQQRQLGCTLTV
jgi:hypothetical protein